MGSAINVIYEIYEEIKNDIGFEEMELVDMPVMLADRSLTKPYAVINNVKIFVGPYCNRFGCHGYTS